MRQAVEIKLSDFGRSKLVRDGYTYARSHVGRGPSLRKGCLRLRGAILAALAASQALRSTLLQKFCLPTCLPSALAAATTSGPAAQLFGNTHAKKVLGF